MVLYHCLIVLVLSTERLSKHKTILRDCFHKSANILRLYIRSSFWSILILTFTMPLADEHAWYLYVNIEHELCLVSFHSLKDGWGTIVISHSFLGSFSLQIFSRLLFSYVSPDTLVRILLEQTLPVNPLLVRVSYWNASNSFLLFSFMVWCMLVLL